MMRRIMLLLPLIFFFGCGGPEVKMAKVELEGVTVKIEAINAKITLPENYVECSFEGYKRLLAAGENEKEFMSKFKFRSLPKGSKVFYNSESIGNHILFINGGYVPFDRELAKQFIALQHSKWTETWEEMGISAERIQSAFMESGTANIVKVRYHLLLEPNYTYVTQYVITRNKRSFAFSVFNPSEDDFQDYITSIKFY